MTADLNSDGPDGVGSVRDTAASGGLPHNPVVEETPTEARQARRGTPVLIVLIAGLVLAVLAWGAAEWWGESTAPPADQTTKPPAGNPAPADSGGASNAPKAPGAGSP